MRLYTSDTTEKFSFIRYCFITTSSYNTKNFLRENCVVSLVTVIITTYKRKPELLKRAINSVISQTFTDWEIIVVDDSPADYELRDEVRDTVQQFSAEYRILYVQHTKNLGASAARNTGINLAKGDYVSFLDDDDEYLPQKLEHQLNRFTPDIGLVYCRHYHIDDSSGQAQEVLKPCLEGRLYDVLMRENVIGAPSFVMVRTECLESVGEFDVWALTSEDYDLWVRLAERYNVGFVDEALVNYHDNHGEHSDTLSRRLEGQEYFYAKHREYIQTHAYINCKKLSALSILSRKTGHYGKAFTYWLRALPLQPIRIWTHIKEFAR